MMKTDLNILYEDNHIIVVVKPENVLSQLDSTEDEDISNMIKDYLKEKYNKPGNVYLGLVHRLDRRVSGVMVFAKTSKAASRLSEEIRKQDMKKTYYAIVVGEVKKSSKIVSHLKKVKIKGNPKAVITKESDGDAKESILNYELIKSVIIDNEVFSLVEVDLVTGRYNQIRAQFADINHPIVNDFKYGYRLKNYGDNLGLACIEISFNHPITKDKMTFRHIPTNGIWKSFI